MKAVAFVLLATQIASAQERSAAATAWWSHVQYLADDKLGGRRPGTEGFAAAVAYVSDQFGKAGLQPAGTEKWIQPVRFRKREYHETGSKLQLLGKGEPETLTLGQDANIYTRGTSGKTITAKAVFIGHGLQVPEHGVDDLKGLNLKGKIAVFLSSAPKSLPGPLAAHVQAMGERWRVLKAAGAIGIATIANPAIAEVPWARSTLARFQPTFTLVDPDLDDLSSMKIQISINAEHADKFFRGTGHSIAELLALDSAGKELPRFPLAAKIQSTVEFAISETDTGNVVGLLPGSDPQLRSEHIVISAHLDHLGTGRPVNGDAIYNGAMDNASGIASMIEAAKLLRNAKLPRSVLFVAVTGEEMGLLGSKYFAAHPTVPLQSLIADINMDMFLPILPIHGLAVQGIEESDLGPEFAKVSERFGVKALPDPEPERKRFIRSDQYSFIRRGIPSLAFKVYAGLNTPEYAVMQEWLTHRYHAPSDDLQQPVDVEGAAKFTQILAAMIEDIAKRPDRPSWNNDSFFRRFAAPQSPGSSASHSGHSVR